MSEQDFIDLHNELAAEWKAKRDALTASLSSMKRERDSLQRQSEIDGARINSLTKERDEAIALLQKS